MSAIIETHTRGRFHVTDHPRDVRRDLRHAAEHDYSLVYPTVRGKLVEIHAREVKRIRPPHESRPWVRKTVALLATILLCVPLLIGGTALMALGGYALLSGLFGNGADVNMEWWHFFVGLAAWYSAGAVGTWAADVFGI
jgi:hypothetical protein